MDDARFHDFVQSMLPKVHLVDRVLHVSDQGGKFGLGEIIAQGDIDEDHWAIKVHFIKDPVIPGSLMREAVNQIEFFFLMHSGIILALINI